VALRRKLTELLSAEIDRAFAFANAVRLFGTQNPDFFEGTPVAAAAEVLGKAPVRAPAE
jgi:hypothetical protein